MNLPRIGLKFEFGIVFKLVIPHDELIKLIVLMCIGEGAAWPF